MCECYAPEQYKPPTTIVLSENGFLLPTNSLPLAGFSRKRILITVDPAEKCYHVQHPGLGLVRLVGMKEVGGMEIPFCVMGNSLGCAGELDEALCCGAESAGLGGSGSARASTLKARASARARSTPEIATGNRLSEVRNLG